MPVYNAESYLAQAVRSILAQTIQGLELICVDDGSTDSSADVLARAAALDTAVTVVHQSNAGVAAALNAGLQRARAPFIARMDADDIASPHRLAKQLLALRAQPSVVAMGSWYREVDAAGRSLGKPICSPPEHAPIVRRLLAGDPGALRHPTVVMRRHAVQALGGYDPDTGHAEDVDLFLRLAELGELANLPDVLLDYRVHDASVTNAHRRTHRLDVDRVVTRAVQPRPAALAS